MKVQQVIVTMTFTAAEEVAKEDIDQVITSIANILPGALFKHSILRGKPLENGGIMGFVTGSVLTQDVEIKS